MADLSYAVVEPEACITAVVHIFKRNSSPPFCENGNHANTIRCKGGFNTPR